MSASTSSPRLQFWQLDDAYFENPDSINTLVRLPEAWRIRQPKIGTPL